MPRKKLRVVSLDEVKITRRGDSAEFEYADDELGSMTLMLGIDVSELSDEELVARHNDTIRAMEELAANYEHVAVEVPPGSPQIRYFELADQWTPRGDVLRCVVDDRPDGEPVIEIDDRQLSLREFGRLLSTYSGWGMRIVFVPEDEIHETPVVEVHEPEDPEWPEADAILPPEQRSPGPRGTALTRAPRSPAAENGPRALPRKPIYQLRATLLGIEPAIWRTFLVSGNRSLKKVHEMLQTVFGWSNSHRHLFEREDGRAAISDPRFGLENARDETRVKLRSFAPEAGARFRYEYDFGDGWEHEVVVEKILDADEVGATPRCLGGERACPPEDSGGIAGYFDLVGAICDPAHPDRELYLDWLGDDFDPEAFDLDRVNSRLRAVK